MNSFLGYERQRGPAGIRNYVVVIATELSGNPWAVRIASHVVGPCCAVTHKHGLADLGSDRRTFIRVITGILCHPNVAGGIILATGNEEFAPTSAVEKAQASGRKVHLLSLKDFQGAEMMMARGVQLAQGISQESQCAPRVVVALEQLRIGLNCAGTDRFSLRTSHAVCGAAVDRLIKSGGTAILTEIPEMIGLGNKWLDRATDPDVRKRLRTIIGQHRKRLSAGGGGLSKNEMCPFNLDGGLKDLAQKSAVSIRKAGRSRINEVVQYGEAPSGTGLVVMDGPAMTDLVITGLLSAGAHLMLNCCGAGIANRLPFVVGADAPPPIMPVIKLTGSSGYFGCGENRIDFNADTTFGEGCAAEKLAATLLELVIRVASGAQTCTEEHDAKSYLLNLPLRFGQA